MSLHLAHLVHSQLHSTLSTCAIAPRAPWRNRRWVTGRPRKLFPGAKAHATRHTRHGHSQLQALTKIHEIFGSMFDDFDPLVLVHIHSHMYTCCGISACVFRDVSGQLCQGTCLFIGEADRFRVRMEFLSKGSRFETLNG